MSIYKKILAIQKNINNIKMDGKVSLGNNVKGYEYLTGEQLFGTIKPLMNEQGVILKTEVLEIVNVKYEYPIKNGQKVEILSTVKLRYTWVDTETGETDVNLFESNGMNGMDKGASAAITIGKRYFLEQFFNIGKDKDDNDSNPEADAPDKKYVPQKNNDTPRTLPPQPAVSEKKIVNGFQPVRQELLPNTPEWKEATKYIAEGGTIEMIRKKYTLTNNNAKALSDAATLIHA